MWRLRATRILNTLGKHPGRSSNASLSLFNTGFIAFSSIQLQAVSMDPGVRSKCDSTECSARSHGIVLTCEKFDEVHAFLVVATSIRRKNCAGEGRRNAIGDFHIASKRKVMEPGYECERAGLRHYLSWLARVSSKVSEGRAGVIP